MIIRLGTYIIDNIIIYSNFCYYNQLRKTAAEFIAVFIRPKKKNNDLIRPFLYFTVYRLGGCGYIRVQPGERSELQRRVRILHENGALPKLGRNTAHLGRHTG